MKSFERIVFFALLASIPIQIGKHFWPHFSFVQGIRVDYLSPTVYLSDIAFLILFLTSFIRLKKELVSIIYRPLFIFTFLALFLSSIFSVQPSASLYGLFKLLQFFYIAFYVAHSLNRKIISPALFIIILGGLVEVIISFFQLTAQRSLGGVFYLLGERTFEASTPGIALFHWGERLILRPYGTFPHPNVLAFYLLLGFILLLFTIDLKDKKLSVVKLAALLILSFGIIITFSRVILLLLLCSISVWIISYARGINKSMRVRILIILGIVICVFVSILISQFSATLVRDAVLSVELITIGLQAFANAPLFGVGLNNFFYHEIFYQKAVTPILLQPIHNIFLMWIVQTGVFGFIILVFFARMVRANARTLVVSMLLVTTVTVGMFDHYLLTLQQGQLMLSIIFGFVFSKTKA